MRMASTVRVGMLHACLQCWYHGIIIGEGIWARLRYSYPRMCPCLCSLSCLDSDIGISSRVTSVSDDTNVRMLVGMGTLACICDLSCCGLLLRSATWMNDGTGSVGISWRPHLSFSLSLTLSLSLSLSFSCTHDVCTRAHARAPCAPSPSHP